MSKSKPTPVLRRKVTGHIRLVVENITVNGVRLADINIDTDVYEGESFTNAIERAKREQQTPKKAR